MGQKIFQDLASYSTLTGVLIDPHVFLDPSFSSQDCIYWASGRLVCRSFVVKVKSEVRKLFRALSLVCAAS